MLWENGEKQIHTCVVLSSSIDWGEEIMRKTPGRRRRWFKQKTRPNQKTKTRLQNNQTCLQVCEDVDIYGTFSLVLSTCMQQCKQE